MAAPSLLCTPDTWIAISRNVHFVMMHLDDPVIHYRRDAELYDYFAEAHPMDRDTSRRIQEAVFHTAEFGASGTVLDIGSGNGWLTNALKHSRYTVVSLDLGKRNLEKIHGRYGEKAHGVVANASILPFADRSFDRVIASEIMEHMNNPEALVAEAFRILKPGGRLIISTPYKEILRTYLCVHCNQQTPANAHIQSFNEQRHISLFHTAGFPTPSYKIIQNKLFVFSRLSYVFRFLPYRLWRMIDGFCMLFIRKAHTIVVSASKQ